ncbi:MAG: 30S ribosomal protein S18 [Caldilinea sp. CFX5]|nr:30S ribosomal protein S18 [Caldilinea sp. CFX5]
MSEQEETRRPARQEQRRPNRPQQPVNDTADGDDDDFNVPAEFSPDSVSRPRRIGSNIRIDDIDYKNVAMLTRFIDGRGRILSRRKTRVSAKVQRRIVTAIKRARHLALLPYTADQSRIVRKRR